MASLSTSSYRADYYPFEGSALRKCPVDIFSTEPVGAEGMPNRQTTDGDYRYAYQGQEKDKETNKEAFELRLWDSRIGRWLTTDPFAEFASPYLGMGNNPISLIDPDGGQTDCPNCLDNVDVFGNFTGRGPTGIFNSQFDQFLQQQNSLVEEQNKTLVEAQKRLQNNKLYFQQFTSNFGNLLGYTAGALSGAQLGYVNYRKTVPINFKVGSFGQFAKTYGGLGRAASKLGYFGALVSTGSNVIAYRSGSIGMGTLYYRTSTLGLSIGVGATIGGPLGALVGIGVGGASVLGEAVYDQAIEPEIQDFFHQLGKYYQQSIQNGFNNLRNGISQQ